RPPPGHAGRLAALPQAEVVDHPDVVLAGDHDGRGGRQPVLGRQDFLADLVELQLAQRVGLLQRLVRLGLERLEPRDGRRRVRPRLERRPHRAATAVPARVGAARGGLAGPRGRTAERRPRAAAGGGGVPLRHDAGPVRARDDGRAGAGDGRRAPHRAPRPSDAPAPHRVRPAAGRRGGPPRRGRAGGGGGVRAVGAGGPRLRLRVRVPRPDALRSPAPHDRPPAGQGPAGQGRRRRRRARDRRLPRDGPGRRDARDRRRAGVRAAGEPGPCRRAVRRGDGRPGGAAEGVPGLGQPPQQPRVARDRVRPRRRQGDGTRPAGRRAAPGQRRGDGHAGRGAVPPRRRRRRHQEHDPVHRAGAEEPPPPRAARAVRGRQARREAADAAGV
ncbi:MAG: hypothetical protein AVDCRST_MAG64-3297, partial [uncultured Phycisphaerae bacterium]